MAFMQRFGAWETSKKLWERLCELRLVNVFEYGKYELQLMDPWDKWVETLAIGKRAPKFLKRDRFVAGLCPPFKDKVKARFPVTFEAARDVARLNERKLSCSIKKQIKKETEEFDHHQDANSPKDAWDNLIAFNATNTRARKIQLKNELNTIKKGELSVNDYTLKIKDLCEFLSSIGGVVDDDDKVETCLHGLGNAYKQIKTSICTRENIPHFLELASLLVVEEKSLIDNGAIQTKRNSSK
ncbi:hypothetical protein L7F22_055443 [Adiantum nelumboides]|nr:hypothetical protein [Adiantum nelumboides]